jgi:acylphosphatase
MNAPLAMPRNLAALLGRPPSGKMPFNILYFTEVAREIMPMAEEGKKTDLQRREVHYSGRVQGVGFRYTVRSVARGFAVDGFVKNTRDGRVQLVVEGTAAEIRAFLAAIQAEMRHYVADTQELSGPATGRFNGFEIRF